LLSGPRPLRRAPRGCRRRPPRWVPAAFRHAATARPPTSD